MIRLSTEILGTGAIMVIGCNMDGMGAVTQSTAVSWPSPVVSSAAAGGGSAGGRSQS